MPTESRDDNTKSDERFVDVGSFCYSVSAVVRVCSLTDTKQREDCEGTVVSDLHLFIDMLAF